MDQLLWAAAIEVRKAIAACFRQLQASMRLISTMVVYGCGCECVSSTPQYVVVSCGLSGSVASSRTDYLLVLLPLLQTEARPSCPQSVPARVTDRPRSCTAPTNTWQYTENTSDLLYIRLACILVHHLGFQRKVRFQTEAWRFVLCLTPPSAEL